MLRRLKSLLRPTTAEPSVPAAGPREDEGNPPEDGPPRFRVDWVARNRLAIGPLPQERHIERLETAGIRSIFTLCSEEEGTPPAPLLLQCRWERLQLRDHHYDEPLTAADLAAALAVLDRLLTEAAPVYIHCVAAVERSPSVVIAWLCHEMGMDVWEALRYLKQAHPSTAPTREQLAAIRLLVETTVPS